MATMNAFAKALFDKGKKGQGPERRAMPLRDLWNVPLTHAEQDKFLARTGKGWGRFTSKAGEVVNWAAYHNGHGLTYNKYLEDQPEVVEDEQA